MDSTGDNISEKNPFYGEYTFYYWYWKNLLKKKKSSEWIGFCSYRELWGDSKDIKNKNSINSLLKKLPDDWENYDAVIGEPIVLKRPNISKILKYGKIASVKNFRELLNSRFSIKYHFDMFHGNGLLFKAIEQLPEKDKRDFKESLLQLIIFLTKEICL